MAGISEGGIEEKGTASFYLPKQTRQRTTSSHSVGGRIMSSSGQLPPLPNSPEHSSINNKFRIGSIVGSRNSSTSSFIGGNNNNNRYYYFNYL